MQPELSSGGPKCSDSTVKVIYVTGEAQNRDSAIDAFRRAADMAGDDQDNRADSLTSLGVELMDGSIHLENTRDLAEAQVVLDEAVEMNPNVAGGYSCLGKVRHQLWQYEQALEDYDHALEADPNCAATYRDMGRTLSELERFNGAVLDYDKCIECSSDGDLRYIAYMDRGIALMRLGEVERAVASLSEAIRLEPEEMGAYINRGLVFGLLGSDSAAAQDYARAVELGFDASFVPPEHRDRL